MPLEIQNKNLAKATDASMPTLVARVFSTQKQNTEPHRLKLMLLSYIYPWPVVDRTMLTPHQVLNCRYMPIQSDTELLLTNRSTNFKISNFRNSYIPVAKGSKSSAKVDRQA